MRINSVGVTWIPEHMIEVGMVLYSSLTEECKDWNMRVAFAGYFLDSMHNRGGIWQWFGCGPEICLALKSSWEYAEKSGHKWYKNHGGQGYGSFRRGTVILGNWLHMTYETEIQSNPTVSKLVEAFTLSPDEACWFMIHDALSEMGAEVDSKMFGVIAREWESNGDGEEENR